MAEESGNALRRLFDLVFEAEASERAAILERECGRDNDLRRRVEAMVAAAEGEGFLSEATAHGLPRMEGARTIRQPGGTEGPGTRIGPYKLLQLIGEGGFGSVFMAEQEKPVARKVALKIIKLGMDTKAVIARFEAERQALALMDHPNIARVLDAGATELGRPYFVMELCKGDPIAEYSDKNNLSIEERLELFAQVCTAVQHAHTKGIIHRDIKPSNILVSTQDGRAHAKVIDFGIAKATASKLTEKTLFTEHKALIGTPEYMSPEQAEGSLDIDTRTDVYSLGVLLYELLTGTTPFSGKELRSAAFGEIQRIIREVEPPKPSTRISQSGDTIAGIAAKRHTEPKRLGVLIRGELDWIVMKALEKDRSRRYETANGIAMDIRRYLAGEAVVAAPPSQIYRVKKFVRRHRAGVMAVAAAGVVLIIGVVAFAWQAKIARAQRDLAIAAEQAAAEARKGADASRDRAVAAELETKKRAEELQKVSDFQAKMLSQVDATQAGMQLTRDVTAKFETALTKAGVPEAERAERVRGFGEDWSNVNATDAARELIDRTILKPAVEAIDKEFADQPEVDAKLRLVLAERYKQLGLSDAARPLIERAIATRRRTLGDDHPETLAAIDEMAYMLADAQKGAEALPYAQDAFEKRRRVLGEDAPGTVDSMATLGRVYFLLGRLSDAVPLMSAALDKARRVIGSDHETTLDMINNLAVVLQTQGKLDEAETLYREALDARRRTLGEDHPHTLQSIGNIAALLSRRGRWSDAEPLYREVVEKRRRILGEDHPGTLNAIGNLGACLQAQEKLTEAEPYIREVVEKSLRVLGRDNPSTLTALANLGVQLFKQKKFEEAVKTLAPIESSERNTFRGGNAWRFGRYLQTLGRSRTAIGEFVPAEGNLLEAHQAFLSSRGEGHEDTRNCRLALSELYAAWNGKEPGKGYDAKAEEWKEKLNAVHTPQPGPSGER